MDIKIDSLILFDSLKINIEQDEFLNDIENTLHAAEVFYFAASFAGELLCLDFLRRMINNGEQ